MSSKIALFLTTLFLASTPLVVVDSFEPQRIRTLKENIRQQNEQLSPEIGNQSGQFFQTVLSSVRFLIAKDQAIHMVS